MKKYIKNPKKGAAIELALLIIFIVVALSTLIVSFSSMGSAKTKKMAENLSSRVLLDMIAQDYIECMLNGSEEEFLAQDGFAVNKSEEGDTINLFIYRGEKLGLAIELEKKIVGTETSYIVLKWKY